MILARVKGNVVASYQYPCFDGQKIMIVQPIDANGNDKGKTFLSCDSVQAGPGDVVLVEQEGNCAREILGSMKDPYHSVIMGIVDKVTTEKN